MPASPEFHQDGRSRIAGIRDRIPWNRLGALHAVVVLGLSQIVFTLILGNRDYFPGGAWFYFSVLVWVQLLPFAVLVGVETLLVRWQGYGRAFRVWRATLYLALFLSLLRQAQIHYPDPFMAAMMRLPLLPPLIAAAALVFFLCLRFRRVVHLYAGYLGVLSFILTGVFIARSDMVNRPWKAAGGDPDVAVRADDHPTVVLIVFDELSYDILQKDGTIDAESFPNFASLAEESAWFANATTNHLYTKDAIPTMLTGLMYPRWDARTLFDRVPAGYDTWIATGTIPAYRWVRRHANENHRLVFDNHPEWLIRSPLEIPAYLAAALSETPITHSPFRGQPSRRLLPPDLWAGASRQIDREEEITTFLSELKRASDRPQLLFWHCWFPHAPFIMDAGGRKHDRPNVAFNTGAKFNSWSRAFGRIDGSTYSPKAVWLNYREQVRYVDSVLGTLIKRLRNTGLYERAVLLVTSDHGLKNHGQLEPEGFPEILSNHGPKIPLFIRAPGVRPGRRDVDYQHLDLVATVLDLVGHPDAARDTEGVSAFAPRRPVREKIFNVFEDAMTGAYVYDPGPGIWKRRPRPGR